jgi:hypothetical protein
LAVTIGAAATMAKAFGALIKVIYDFVASDLSPAARQLNIIYASLLAIEIFLCLVISIIDIDEAPNPRRFCCMSFFLEFVELCVLTVRGVMDIMDANGVFYGIGEESNNACKDSRRLLVIKVAKTTCQRSLLKRANPRAEKI